MFRLILVVLTALALLVAYGFILAALIFVGLIWVGRRTLRGK